MVESLTMELAALVAGLCEAAVVGDPATEVSGLAYHTGAVRPGSLFFCVPGLKADGHDFASQAVAAGASALVCERRLPTQVTQVIVPSVRRAMALMAARYYGDPSGALRVAGVTGTNGKTTTAHLLASIFTAAGLRPALLGTVVNRIGGREEPVQLTTAESCDLQAMLRAMVESGDLSCAMEVSSHALVLERTVGIHFAAVVFTNLTRDHLDFHGDIESYFAAKRRLFVSEGTCQERGVQRQGEAVAVVNVGDTYGRRLAAECRPLYGDDLWTYRVAEEGPAQRPVASETRAANPHGVVDPVEDDTPATAVARDIALAVDGTQFTLLVPKLNLESRVSLRLVGAFNVANALAAATTALAMGIAPEAVLAGLESAHGVPGRFEAVRAGQPFAVIVDYSHTPDSLENALEAARGFAAGRLICVFGCGGDRDRGKRPLMGEIATRLADHTIITSDNPRSEDPLAIIDEILAGVHEGRAVVEPDRRVAIEQAVAQARPGDVVLIAGKGHETGQIIGSVKVPFDDRLVARAALERIGYESKAPA